MHDPLAIPRTHLAARFLLVVVAFAAGSVWAQNASETGGGNRSPAAGQTDHSVYPTGWTEKPQYSITTTMKIRPPDGTSPSRSRTAGEAAPSLGEPQRGDSAPGYRPKGPDRDVARHGPRHHGRRSRARHRTQP
jgi:hypothetical protein